MNKQIVVMGPTASGKTTIAVELARHLDGQILSADSRQLYMGGDLASGKDLADYEGVDYHLIDCVDINTEYSVFNYQQDALRVRDRLQKQGVPVIIAGGTQFYIEALLARHKMIEVPHDPSFNDRFAGQSLEAIVEQLLASGGATHNVTDTQDRSRALRALEISLASQQIEPVPIKQVDTLICANIPSSELRRQLITQRLDQRLGQGMVDEIAQLRAGGVSNKRLDMLGLEYRYIGRYLEGDLTLEAMKEQLSQQICRFAKQQAKGVRRLIKKGWPVMLKEEGETVAQFVERVLQEYEKR